MVHYKQRTASWDCVGLETWDQDSKREGNLDLYSASWNFYGVQVWITDDCQLVSDVGRRRLRSSDISTCVVPRTHTGFGDRAFQVAGPRLWNSLPASLHQSDTTVGQFKKLLKTDLFSWDCGALVTVAFTAPCINISTTTTTTTTTTTQNSHSFTCKQHHTCLYLVRLRQTAPPPTVVADS